jgi:hypothetical protein
MIIGTIASSMQKSLLNGLLAYWKLNESSSAQVIDATGNGHNSTSNTALSATGKLGTSMMYNNTGSTIIASSSAWATFTGASLTIAGWIYVRAAMTGTFYNIIGNYDGPSVYLRDEATPNQIALAWYPGGQGVQSDVVTWTYGTWYHFAVVKTGMAIAFYQNNVSIGSTGNENAEAPAREITLGTDSGGEVFNGRIDDIGWWNRALTTTELTALYNGGAGLTYPF